MSKTDDTSKKKKKQTKEKVHMHKDWNITNYIDPIDRTFLMWTLTIGIGELLVIGWPITALEIYGGKAILNVVLFFFGIRGIILIYSALSSQRVYRMHGSDGVKHNPLRVLSMFSNSTALALWWTLAFVTGVMFGIIMIGISASTYSFISHHLVLYWITLGFYIGTTIESFFVAQFLYSQAIHNNVMYYKKKDKLKRERAKKKELKKKNVLYEISISTV